MACGGRTGNETIERLARKLAAQLHECGEIRWGRDFEGLLTLLAPRIARHIRQYGLRDMREDAEQVAAIGVHRALASYDPDKASFATHATWQIRGELQGLRHRVRLDQRRSARTAGITTVSLEGLRGDSHGRESSVFEIVDEASLARVESGASDTLASGLIDGLLERLGAPREERRIVRDHLFDRTPSAKEEARRTPEQRRQIIRRTMRNCAKVLAA